MNKLKVGILTLPINNNYGGIIQLAALYNFLETQGFEAIWIDKKHPEKKIKSLLKKFIESNPFYKLYDFKNFKTIKLFYQQVQPFFNKHLKGRTDTVFTIEELKKITSDFDCIIVGSDQVWRLEYVKSNYPTYFLNFVSKKSKKIAYAASFGKDYWEGDNESISKIIPLLKDFNLVTVREVSGLNICKDTFKYNKSFHVLDPSFLPELSFYKNLINDLKFTPKVELFNYVLDSSNKSNQIIEQISSSLNLSIKKIYLNNHGSIKSSNMIENWLAHFYHSNFVVTDSFHGMVFSIIFNKQFIVIENNSRGLSRFYSLLELLDLKDRIINVETFDSAKMEILHKKIDYVRVNEKLEIQKEFSKNILLKSILGTS